MFLNLNSHECEDQSHMAYNLGANFPNIRSNNVEILAQFLAATDVDMGNFEKSRFCQCLFYYLKAHCVSTYLTEEEYQKEMMTIAELLYMDARELNENSFAEIENLFTCVKEVLDQFLTIRTTTTSSDDDDVDMDMTRGPAKRRR